MNKNKKSKKLIGLGAMILTITPLVATVYYMKDNNEGQNIKNNINNVQNSNKLYSNINNSKDDNIISKTKKELSLHINDKIKIVNWTEEGMHKIFLNKIKSFISNKSVVLNSIKTKEHGRSCIFNIEVSINFGVGKTQNITFTNVQWTPVL